MAEKLPQAVRICSQCQKEQGLDEAMKKAHENGVRFSHGLCLRHSEEMMRVGGFSDDMIRTMLDKYKGEGATPPDLAEHPDLVKLYKQGIWTPNQLHQQKQQAAESLNESTDFVKRLKKLAGIKS